MTLGELVHAYREERGMSMQEFADRSNLSKAYISMLERNRNPQSGRPPVPSLETIRSVSHVIGADFNDVIAALDAEEPVSLSYLQSRRPFSDNLLPLEPMERIPLLGQIACGTPILAEQNVEDYVDLPRHIRADFTLTCRGDSMIGAGIQDGDMVYIRQQPEVENGEIAAVMVDEEEATLKRFYFDGLTVQLVAENPKFPPMVFTGEEISRRVHVVGRAVAYTHSL